MPIMLQGMPVTAGVVVGTCFYYEAPNFTIPHEHITGESVAAEQARLQQAISEAVQAITALRDQVRARSGEREAAIFDAHLLLYEDEALLDSAYSHITKDLMNAEWAVWEAVVEFEQMLQSLDDAYFQARVSDLKDVKLRLIAHLQQKTWTDLATLQEPVILVARDLLPSDTALLNPAFVRCVVTEEGGITSHTAIITRQLDIPTVVGVRGLLAAISQTGQEPVLLAVDSRNGEVIVEPDRATCSRFEELGRQYQAEKQELEALHTLPAQTPDGLTLELAANIGRPEDAVVALKAGATAIGLFRTELFFLERTTPPTEDEQTAAYASALQTFAGKPVIIRTLDIGGDKSIPYLALPRENNPFLGLRGIRLCLDPEFQDLFRTQLRALLRAAHTTPDSLLWVMLPMVCDKREIEQSRKMLHDVQAELLAVGVLTHEVLAQIKLGIMVETPAVLWQLDQLIPVVDFLSIGTNDLTQYILASDRMNARLGELQRPFHPAVMRALAHLILTARKHNCWIGMCGEMAGDPRATAFLLGLGINELSMEPSRSGAVKKVVRQTTLAQAQALIERVLALDNALDIEKLLGS